MNRLRVVGDHLETDRPFFWLADTAWELFHRLSREETALYLRDRAEKGFTVIQAVALAEWDGLGRPNAYGRHPLKRDEAGRYDPLQPDLDGDYSYWQHVDTVLDMAAELDLYIALLPCWGDKYNQAWGIGPEIFDGASARAYGRWLGERYAARDNLIWVLGGDREYVEFRHFDVLRNMAAGIREGGATQLITAHPVGERSTSRQLRNEAWLDFHMIQSGHGNAISKTYAMIQADREAGLPVIEAEPNYEDHPIGFQPANGYFDASDVRKASYWAAFAGAMGVTYGHNSVWSFYRFDDAELAALMPNANGYCLMDWQAALARPASFQLQYLRRLLERYGFPELSPDQSLLDRQYEGAGFCCALRGTRAALVYAPCGLPLLVRVGDIGFAREALWYDPRTGLELPAGAIGTQYVQRFLPPSAGRENDWVLVLRAEQEPEAAVLYAEKAVEIPESAAAESELVLSV